MVHSLPGFGSVFIQVISCLANDCLEVLSEQTMVGADKKGLNLG